jgi:transposase
MYHRLMKEDTRKLSLETLEQLRKQAIRLKKKGMSYTEIGDLVGVRRQTVSEWWNSYQAEGVQGLKLSKRGVKPGTNRTLDSDQEIEIQRIICDKSPDQLKLTFALWTRQAVRELILQKWNISMPIRTVGEYLKRWGFTPQKPLKRAYEQRPAEVQQWLDEEYPTIASRAKAEGAEIHWGDETGLRSDSQHGRSYSPKGQTPVIRLSAKRVSSNMISSITNQGKVRFMVYQNAMNAQTLIKFMKRLIADSDKKIFLILDNLRVHHAKDVRKWLGKNQKHIEVFYLPAYSPELNPDEYLNGDLKAGVHSKPPMRNEAELKQAIVSHMRKLQRLPSRIKNYFKHPKIAYAA